MTAFRKYYALTRARAYRELSRPLHRLTGTTRLHFLHIGKTGGTAVKRALRKHTKPAGYVIFLRPHHVTLKDVPAGDSVFFFLRDPVRRFISGFNSRRRQGLPRYKSRWTNDEAAAFARYETPNALANDLSSSDPDALLAAHNAMHSIEHIRNCYWDWFIDEEYFRSRRQDIFFIGYQEKLNDEFLVLKNMLGLPEDILLPTDEVNVHKAPDGDAITLDSTAVRNLQKWYEADYNFMEICRDSMA